VYINGFILSTSYLRDYWNALMSNLQQAHYNSTIDMNMI